MFLKRKLLNIKTIDIISKKKKQAVCSDNPYLAFGVKLSTNDLYTVHQERK